jgi:hypothetical protein
MEYMRLFDKKWMGWVVLVGEEHLDLVGGLYEELYWVAIESWHTSLESV